MKLWITLIACALLTLTPGATLAAKLTVYEQGTCPSIIHPIRLSYSQQAMRLSALISERLARLDATTNLLVPTLYTSLVSKSSQRYEMTLKEGVRFSDGSPLTAEDIEHSFKRLVNQASIEGRLSAKTLYNTLNVIEYVEALSPSRIQFVFRLPVHESEVVPFLAMLPVISRALTDEMLEAPGAPSSGPYTITAANAARILLKSNPYYHLGRPNIDELEIKCVTETEIEAALVNGTESEIFVQVPSRLLGDLKKSTTLSLRPLNSKRITYLGFNRHYGSAFELQPGLRGVIASLVDRTAIRDAMKELGAVVPLLSGPFSYASPYNDPAVEAMPYSPAVATSRLNDMGYKRIGDYFRTDSGKQLAMRILIYNGVPHHTLIASQIKEQLEREGVNTQITTIDRQQLMQLLLTPTGDYDLILHEWLLDESEDIFELYSTRGVYNFLNYKNAALDERLQLERRASLASSRMLYRQEIHRIISRDLPALYLWQNQDYAAARNNIQGIPPLDGYLFFRDIHTWSLEGESPSAAPESGQAPQAGGKS